MYMCMCPHLLGDDVHAHLLGGVHTCWEACICVGGRVYVLGCAFVLWGVCTRWEVCVRVRGGARVCWGACACGHTCVVVTKLVIMYCNRCHCTIIRFFYPEFEILKSA
jgi:hypothetical protein